MLQGVGLWRARLWCLRLWEVAVWGVGPWGLHGVTPYTTARQPTTPPPTARTITTQRDRAHIVQPNTLQLNTLPTAPNTTPAYTTTL